MLAGGSDDASNHCDDCATTISLPFPVNLYDRTSIKAQVESNGYMSLGSAYSSASKTCMPVSEATYTTGTI